LKRAEEAKARLAAIVESSEDAITGQDLEGIITAWNRGAEKLFGYTTAEAIGQPITILMSPEDTDQERRVMEKIRRGESVAYYETIGRHKEGTSFDIWLTVSPVFDEHGTVVGGSRIARDITERKRAEQELAALLASEHAARADAETANRLKDLMAEWKAAPRASKEAEQKQRKLFARQVHLQCSSLPLPKELQGDLNPAGARRNIRSQTTRISAAC